MERHNYKGILKEKKEELEPDSKSIASSEKVCTKCGMAQPLDRFPKDAHRRDGLSNWCRACNAAKAKNRKVSTTYHGPTRRTLELIRKANPAPGEKVCLKCGKAQPPERFSKHVRKQDGLHDWCKTCNAASANNPTTQTPRRRTRELIRKANLAPGERICTKCEEVQPLEQFSKDAHSRRDGLKNWCKTCDGASNRNRFRMLRLIRKVNPASGEKVCYKCAMVRPIEQFVKDAESRDGFRSRCKACDGATAVAFHAAIRGALGDKTEVPRGTGRTIHDSWRQCWKDRATQRCKGRAKEKNLSFDMKPSDLYDASGQLPVDCPMFPHIRLDYDAGPDRRAWASVDRIVPKLGYVSGNVRVVSNGANMWKSNGSDLRVHEIITKGTSE